MTTRTMQLFALVSSNVICVGWEDATMEIHFRNGGIYRYRGVPLAKFGEGLAAPSFGKWFHAEIKSHPDLYPFEPVPVSQGV